MTIDDIKNTNKTIYGRYSFYFRTSKLTCMYLGEITDRDGQMVLNDLFSLDGATIINGTLLDYTDMWYTFHDLYETYQEMVEHYAEELI